MYGPGRSKNGAFVVHMPLPNQKGPPGWQGERDGGEGSVRRGKVRKAYTTKHIAGVVQPKVFSGTLSNL